MICNTLASFHLYLSLSQPLFMLFINYVDNSSALVSNISIPVVRLHQNHSFLFYQNITGVLTLFMPNFLNGIIHLQFLALSIIILRDIKMETCSWSASSIESGQTARMCRLAWLYTGGRLITFGVGRIRVN